jgi:transposase
VDERYEVPLPAYCPGCAGPVRPTGIATQYQEELPVTRVVVRQFDIQVGRCDRCRRRVQGRHPLQTSDALGAAAAQLGAEVIALVVVLKKQLGLSFGKIVTLLQQLYGLTVTRSGLVHAVHRVARQARPTYAALCARVRGSPMVSPDETGWKVAGRLQWLWAFATPDTTIYRIQPGRGFEEAAAVLESDFDGVLVRDGWAPYRQFAEAAHQRVSRICCAAVDSCGPIIHAPDSSPTSRACCTTRWPCAIAIAPAPSRRMASPSRVAISSRVSATGSHRPVPSQTSSDLVDI